MRGRGLRRGIGRAGASSVRVPAIQRQPDENETLSDALPSEAAQTMSRGGELRPEGGSASGSATHEGGRGGSGSAMNAPGAAFSVGSRGGSSNGDGETLDMVRAERDALAFKLNDAKQIIAKKEADLNIETVQRRALVVTVKSYEKEIRELKAEMVGLRKTLENRSDPVERMKRRKGGQVLEDVPMRYFGIASAILRKFSLYCRKETCELDPFAKEDLRRWERRCDFVNDKGVKVADGRMVAPFPPNSLTLQSRYFTFSFEKEKNLLEEIVKTELRSENWGDIFKTQEEEENCVRSLTENKKLCSKLRCTLSDEMSARKRQTRDLFFSSFGYDSLVTRFVPQNEEQKETRKAEVTEVKSKLLKTGADGDLMYSRWRETDIAELCRNGTLHRLGTGVVTQMEENLSLFRHDVSVEILHVFMGYIPPIPMENDEQYKSVEGTIMMLARLDAFIMTVIQCLSDTGRETVGGHRQKLYHDMFCHALPKACNQLIGKIRVYIQAWAPLELDSCVLPLPIEQGGSGSQQEVHRGATAEIIVPSLSRRVIAVRAEYFATYITPELGAVCDCYVAEYDPQGMCMRLLGTAPIENTSGERSEDDGNEGNEL